MVGERKKRRELLGREYGEKEDGEGISKRGGHMVGRERGGW